MLVRVRMVADTRQELEETIDELLAKYPNRLSGFQSIQPGRRGGFIAYGELLSSRAALRVKVVPVDRPPARYWARSSLSEPPAQFNREDRQDMRKKSSQHKKQSDDMAQLGFAGRLEAGQTPHSARQELRANLLSTPGSLEILKELFKENPGYEQESRAEWAVYGLEPPWEGL